MKVYICKKSKIKGSSFHEIRQKAEAIYSKICSRSKRRPYVRSVYFDRDKVFLGLFWKHLFDKNTWHEKSRRLKFFEPGLDLLRKSRLDPTTKENPNKKEELLHRFAGLSKEKELFYVQVKENKRTGQKYLISIFPAK